MSAVSSSSNSQKNAISSNSFLKHPATNIQESPQHPLSGRAADLSSSRAGKHSKVSVVVRHRAIAVQSISDITIPLPAEPETEVKHFGRLVDESKTVRAFIANGTAIS